MKFRIITKIDYEGDVYYSIQKQCKFLGISYWYEFNYEYSEILAKNALQRAVDREKIKKLGEQVILEIEV